MPRYSEERKTSVMRKLLPPNNRTVTEVAKEEGISDATLYNWRNKAREQGIPVPGSGKKTEAWSPEAKFAVVVETTSMNEIDLSEYATTDKTPDERKAIRLQQSKPILEKIKIWLDSKASKVLPKSLLGKAIYYVLGLWPQLMTYLEDGHIPIDNNLAENAIRSFVIGRKAWLFSGSPQCARASAILYSLIETAKVNAQEPKVYLNCLFEQLPLRSRMQGVVGAGGLETSGYLIIAVHRGETLPPGTVHTLLPVLPLTPIFADLALDLALLFLSDFSHFTFLLF